jgi:hypothetical protein
VIAGAGFYRGFAAYFVFRKTWGRVYGPAEAVPLLQSSHCGEFALDDGAISVAQDNRRDLAFVVSHPFAKQPANGWGTDLLW